VNLKNVDKDDKFTEPSDDKPNIRRGIWELHEQTYNYNYTPGMMSDYKPEYSCLYEPESRLDNSIYSQTLDLESMNVMDDYEDFVN